jgi:hypothetical protein
VKCGWPRRIAVGLVLLALLSARAQAAGMQAKTAGFRRAGAAVRVAFQIEDVFTERFRAVLERGDTLYVRIETELWEPHNVWDRLVRSASVSVARLTREPVSRAVVLVDPFGEASTYPSYSRMMTVWADLVPADRIDAAASYYVHATITVGTIAENEINGVSDAMFGDNRQSSGLRSIGKYVVQKVLRLADYLDSVSCEVKTGRLAGRLIKTP